MLDDRAEEAWEPLLAIADLAGGAWPERARLAALELSAGRDEDEARGVWLLRDIRDVFARCAVDRLPSAELAASLSEIETSPWGDIYGKALDARGLARRLKPYRIRPRTIRLDDGTTPKGYLLETFDDAFSRYFGASERHTATTRIDKEFEVDLEPPHAADVKSRKPASAKECGGVAAKSPEVAKRDLELGHLQEVFAPLRDECLVCGEEYLRDEKRPELLRCPDCMAKAAA